MFTRKPLEYTTSQEDWDDVSWGPLVPSLVPARLLYTGIPCYLQLDREQLDLKYLGMWSLSTLDRCIVVHWLSFRLLLYDKTCELQKNIPLLVRERIWHCRSCHQKGNDRFLAQLLTLEVGCEWSLACLKCYTHMAGPTSDFPYLCGIFCLFLVPPLVSVRKINTAYRGII